MGSPRWLAVVVCPLVIAACRPGSPQLSAPASHQEVPRVAGSAEEEAAPTPCGGAPLFVTFYDAGQALAALVTLPDQRRILVDVGESPTRPGCGASCAAWNQRVLDGVTADLNGHPVDLLWITHQHSDHHGGLPSLAATPGFRVLHYVDNGTRSGQSGVVRARKRANGAGAVLHVIDPSHTSLPIPNAADVELEAVVPSQWPVSNCDDDPNECSIGLKIRYCDSSILFTGDAEHRAEAAWPLEDISLLQVGHHGSNTSSTPAFITALAPEYAVIVSGKRAEGTNRTYCHPIKSTVDRLTAATGGAGTRSVTLFDDTERTCRRQTDADWKSVAISDRLWLTAFDGEVRLQTNGDGTFTRLAQP